MPADPTEAGPARRCAILAGGLGTRLGGTKATVELAGRPLISYPIESALEAGLVPVVVAKRSSGLRAVEAELLLEPEIPRHPLLGIVAALAAGAEPIVVCPCDAPLLPPALLRLLADLPDPLVVIDGGRGPEPLIGRYTPGLEPELRAAAERGEPSGATVTGIGARIVGPDELRRFGDPSLLALNVNDPEQLAAAAEVLG